jgi:hypothetical protein
MKFVRCVCHDEFNGGNCTEHVVTDIIFVVFSSLLVLLLMLKGRVIGSSRWFFFNRERNTRFHCQWMNYLKGRNQRTVRDCREVGMDFFNELSTEYPEFDVNLLNYWEYFINCGGSDEICEMCLSWWIQWCKVYRTCCNGNDPILWEWSECWYIHWKWISRRLTLYQMTRSSSRAYWKAIGVLFGLTNDVIGSFLALKDCRLFSGPIGFISARFSFETQLRYKFWWMRAVLSQVFSIPITVIQTQKPIGQIMRSRNRFRWCRKTSLIFRAPTAAIGISPIAVYRVASSSITNTLPRPRYSNAVTIPVIESVLLR